MSQTFKYRYIFDDDDPECALEFTSRWNFSKYPSYVAEEAASKCFHDGAYEDWHFGTRNFTILTESGDFLDKFEVDMEYDPQFSARRIKNPKVLSS